MYYCTDTNERTEQGGGYVAFRRFEQELSNLAHQRGLNGNLFARWIPDMGSELEQLTIADLTLDLRDCIPLGRERDALRMIRAAVLTRTDDAPEPAERHREEIFKHPAIQRASSEAIKSRTRTGRGRRR